MLRKYQTNKRRVKLAAGGKLRSFFEDAKPHLRKAQNRSQPVFRALVTV